MKTKTEKETANDNIAILLMTALNFCISSYLRYQMLIFAPDTWNLISATCHHVDLDLYDYEEYMHMHKSRSSKGTQYFSKHEIDFLNP